ncbi:helix-turn-helix domain-containing protein [Nocardia carnea]|uniref:helix-turn-helix domain-containing protein n=1 Tax=Nocardia carnea TaxID=37328 RepID=UPI003D7BCB4D
MTTVVEPSPFARQLRHWRTQRHVSQLDLAIRADTSQRYLSFLEQGRSRPGRTMVVRLAESLELSLRERNALLLAPNLEAFLPADDRTAEILRRRAEQRRTQVHDALVFVNDESDCAARRIAGRRAGTSRLTVTPAASPTGPRRGYPPSRCSDPP